MARRFSGQKIGTGENILVIKLDKSGGCVDRDEEYLRQYRQAQVREYFFGDSKSTLSPHTQQVDFNQLSIYKIAECMATYLHLL
jgi:polyribonucleotide 5'-hydroxyl-kinase